MHTLSSEGMQGKGCICYVEEDDGHGDLDADGCSDTETESGHSSDTRQPRLQIPPPRDMGGRR